MRISLLLFLFIASFLPLFNIDAAEFQPTLLKLGTNPLIHYIFDCSILEIPVTVTGTPCSAIFSVFTKDREYDIGPVTNGYLGWHYVNKVDTCIYFSRDHQLETGENVIVWDGRDQDGIPVCPGDYTYYAWAYDNVGEKQQACRFLQTYEYVKWTTDMSVQEIDETGLPLAHPFWYRAHERWSIGHDPRDEAGLITSNIILDTDWKRRGVPQLQPDNFNNFFLSVGNDDQWIASLQKLKFIPGGDAEIISDWGDAAPYAAIYSTVGGTSPGVVSDGDYLYTADDNHFASNDPDSQFYIYDMDGFLIDEVDLSSWWCSEDSFAANGQMNGGPSYFSERNGYVFMNANTSCLIQMIAPLRYLDTGEINDLIVWSNGNGDYVYDRNFEESADRPWICNDYNMPFDTYNISSDSNNFSISTTYSGTSFTSFGLLAPDGTGLGYYAFAGEGHGPKNGNFLIDSDTPFDGLYCDNVADYLPGLEKPITEDDIGIFYLGQDSVRGVISGSVDIFSTSKFIDIITPDEGCVLNAGQAECLYYIPWMIDSVTVEFSSNGGVDWTEIDPETDMITRTAWRVPDIESNDCYIRVTDADDPGCSETSGPFTITGGAVGIEDHSPAEFSLGQNYPNPFNPVTTIPFSISAESYVRLTVYSVLGQCVATLADERLSAGKHSVLFDSEGLSSGVYLYRLEAGEFRGVGSMLLVK